MAKHLIVVGGLGDYGTNLIRPCKDFLINQGYIDGISIVDITEGYQKLDSDKINKLYSENIKIFLRKKDSPLSEAIDSMGHDSPLVLLAHHNSFHTPDAIDLIENSSRNPKILIEKPYAISLSQLEDLEKIIAENPQKIALPEYGMALKGTPTLMLQGKIKQDSFYFGDMGIIQSKLTESNLESISGKFHDLIGDVKSVISFYLEGEGSTGVIGNRTLSLVDKTQGGGMIQDLFHHSIAFIGDSLGGLNDYKINDVRMGFCDDYLNEFIPKVGIENIGESSARISLVSPKKIPIVIYVGKYTPENTNFRECHIKGTKGGLIQDMSSCNLWYFNYKDSKRLLLQADKSGKNFPKYASTLMASIDYLEGNNPYTFDPTNHLLGIQKLILNILDAKPSKVKNHSRGADYKEIFLK